MISRKIGDVQMTKLKCPRCGAIEKDVVVRMIRRTHIDFEIRNGQIMDKIEEYEPRVEYYLLCRMCGCEIKMSVDRNGCYTNDVKIPFGNIVGRDMD